MGESARNGATAVPVQVQFFDLAAVLLLLVVLVVVVVVVVVAALVQFVGGVGWCSSSARLSPANYFVSRAQGCPGPVSAGPAAAVPGVHRVRARPGVPGVPGDVRADGLSRLWPVVDVC